MKLFFLFIAIIISMATTAQVKAVSLKASGLTCSMCSNAINKALKTLDFVDRVEANIKDYSFNISFKEGYTIDFNRIKKRVEDAGFSVAGFMATIEFPNTSISAGNKITVNNISLLFLRSISVNGIQQVKIVNRGFVSAKEYKLLNLPAQAAAGTYYALIN